LELAPAPGRILIVGPAHTFEQLAEAINQAFALSDLHEFELAVAAGSASPARNTRPSSSGRTMRR
jgi:hypothetical protein